MMLPFIFIALTILAGSTTGEPAPNSPPMHPSGHHMFKCPKNEIWTDCGSACEPSCHKPHPKICTQQCVIGCRCKGGLVRDHISGACMHLWHCPMKHHV